MSRHFTMVVSDVHLAPVFRSDRLPFRGPAFQPDAELSRAIDRALEIARRNQGALELVLAGDFFDLDVAQNPWDVENASRTLDVRTAAGAAKALAATLRDHPGVVLALRRALTAGTRVTIVPGNHDAQLAIPAVAAVLRASVEPPPTDLRLRLRPWCHITADGAVVVEHGHQYDPLCVVRRLVPHAHGDGPGDLRAEATIGTVSSFYAPLLIPGSDPFAVDPFVERRGMRAILMDALSRGGAAIHAMRELILASADEPEPDPTPALAAELGVDPQIVGLRRALFADKATARALLDLAQETPGAYGRLVEHATARAMTTATDVHRARVAVVGHTHAPRRSDLPNGAVLLNSGSWTPRRSSGDPVGSFAWIVTSDGHVVDAHVEPVRRER